MEWRDHRDDSCGVFGANCAVHLSLAPAIDRAAQQKPLVDPAVARQSGQLPAFAPLLEELEIAGWSSHRGSLSGNFHDWLLLEGRMILVAVGQAVGESTSDLTESALVTQAAWASIRAHARHVRDAGQLLTLVGQTLWPMPNAAVEANLALAMIDTSDGHASLAMAGDCLAWKIRAATSEQFPVHQPPSGRRDRLHVSLSHGAIVAPRENRAGGRRSLAPIAEAGRLNCLQFRPPRRRIPPPHASRRRRRPRPPTL